MYTNGWNQINCKLSPSNLKNLQTGANAASSGSSRLGSGLLCALDDSFADLAEGFAEARMPIAQITAIAAAPARRILVISQYDIPPEQRGGSFTDQD
jgi:hypothetical protein